MSSDWSPCIVTMLDLAGTKSLAPSGKGSSAMISMHRQAVAKINHGLPLTSHGYVWNDSVLLLSYMNEPGWTYQDFFSEIDDFKHYIESACGARLYGVSVKGLAFPPDMLAPAVFNGQMADQPRAIVLKTSSWAMANCFIAETALKKHKADWYIDSRLTRHADLATPFATEEVSLLPKNEARKFGMYKGKLTPSSTHRR